MACPQHSTAPQKKTGRWPLLSAFLLIILPKCPYCLVAYSSAITICGLPVSNAHAWEPYLITILILVILISLLRSFRGPRTWVALSIAVVGIVFLAAGFQNSALIYYHLGSGLMLLSTLVNRKIFKIPPGISQVKHLLR